MACRCTKVPRRESCPDSRTVTPWLHQRAERDDLGEAPVDVALDGHLGPPLEQLGDPLVRGEAVRQAGRAPRRSLGQHDGVDRGVHLRAPARRSGRAPAGPRRWPFASRVALKTCLQLRLVVAQQLLGLLQRDVAAADELLGVDLPHRSLAVDDLVHLRVGHRRVVALVVARAGGSRRRSMTTSLLNACRYSKASRATRSTASGSSPFTWKIGAWIMRATSVE